MLRINLAKVQAVTDDSGTQTPDENISTRGHVTTEHFPHLDKGKGCLINTSISNGENDKIHLAQISADACMACLLQDELDKIHTQHAMDYHAAGPSGHHAELPTWASSQMPQSSHLH